MSAGRHMTLNLCLHDLLLVVDLGPATSLTLVGGQEAAVLRRGLEGMRAGKAYNDDLVHGLGDEKETAPQVLEDILRNMNTESAPAP